MSEEIILCIDMQKRQYIFDLDAACENINVFSKEAATRGIPTWYVFFIAAPELQNVILNADTTQQERTKCLKIFEQSPHGGVGSINLSRDATIIFKNRESVLSNACFENELRKQGVKRLNIVGCTADVCLPLSAVDLSGRGYEVVMAQDLSYGAESAKVARTSQERAEEIKTMLYRLPSDLRRPQSSEAYDMARKAYFIVERFNKAWAPFARRLEQHPHLDAIQKIKITTSEDILLQHPPRSGFIPNSPLPSSDA